MTAALVLTGRSLRHARRSVDALLVAVLLPVALLLMFVHVFGGALAAGAHAGRYVDYVVPGIVLLCAAFGSATTAVGVCHDVNSGALDRFRTLSVPGAAVLAGHVGASVARNLVSTGLVLAVALLDGFRPHASALDWLAAAALLVAFMAAVSWIAACVGLLTRDPEAASGFSMLMTFVPYVSSAFVPPSTMPGVLRRIAEHQPVTPVIETLRALLLGTPAGGHAVAALAWCAGGIVLGAVAAGRLFRARTAR